MTPEADQPTIPLHPPHIQALMAKYPEARESIEAALREDQRVRQATPQQRREMFLACLERIIAVSDARVVEAEDQVIATNQNDPGAIMTMSNRVAAHDAVCRTVQCVLAYLNIYWPPEA